MKAIITIISEQKAKPRFCVNVTCKKVQWSVSRSTSRVLWRRSWRSRDVSSQRVTHLLAASRLLCSSYSRSDRKKRLLDSTSAARASHCVLSWSRLWDTPTCQSETQFDNYTVDIAVYLLLSSNGWGFIWQYYITITNQKCLKLFLSEFRQTTSVFLRRF